MKTLKQVQDEKQKLLHEKKELEDNISKVQHADAKAMKRQVTAINKRLAFLKSIGLYLETSPTVEFIKQEKKRLTTRKDLIYEEFTKKHVSDEEVWDRLTLSQQKKMRSDFNKEMGVPKINTQLASLNYLLN